MNLNQEEFNQINKIMALSVLINEKTKFCVFIRFSGHVDELEISIKESKKKYNSEIADAEIKLKDLTWENTKKSERYEDVIKTLEEFLKQEKVPYDYLYKIERIEYDYKF